jgi:hypothetical protein
VFGLARTYFCCFLFLAIFTSACTVEPLPSHQADGTLQVSATAPPTDLPYGITSSPFSTYPAISQQPAITGTPGVLNCTDIVDAHKASTAKEWEATKTSYRGREIYYLGTVYSVTEKDAVHMSGTLCHFTLHHVPHEIAVNLSHGQFVEGYRTILNINYYLGEDIDIEANPELIFMR